MSFSGLFQRRRVAQMGVGLLAASALAVFAQNSYPSKPVRIVVGFSAGGTTDVVARIMAKELTQSLGQSFIIENRPGGGSNIATEVVKAADPDGYTLLFVAVTSAINQTLYPKIKFDLNRDFEAVALGAKVPNILVVHPSVPANNVKEFIEWARTNDDKIAYASSGSGTSIHMAGEMFKVRTGLKTQHVPYKGSAPAVTDLIGGQVQFMFDNMPASWPHVQSGKLKALAVTTKTRSPSAPNVPTLEESGVAPFDVTSWFGLIAPKGTPKEVVDKLNLVMNQAFDKPEVKLAYEKLGAVAEKNSPKDFSNFIRQEVSTWAPVVKASGATVD
ncbi:MULTISPECIES: tripartite tricarboxylate transporter substrate binding protein [Comamonas]|mgnify:FL=1|jgi:tripartite-type tricarboxylate transporter receptor subunit TctC|uniref:Tripartite tricarboxylate transporter substrate binding protein n=1 Tax=Comamonas avium TaxID=2762231 RepID=A0ABR8S651_9BURK|nr:MULTISPECIES: tripartite tricarboxylate transporter substrate binding protein [Comamonas]MBD7958864.1 tripartite tricarboxylate transporter substrate binding protein [Comamonas avium]MBD9403363.1 tripartite tricarboxylate transporter substrate binding protein [Comamonas sp. CMM02]